MSGRSRGGLRTRRLPAPVQHSQPCPHMRPWLPALRQPPRAAKAKEPEEVVMEEAAPVAEGAVSSLSVSSWSELSRSL